MLEESILTLDLPYRDPLDVHGFSFGIDASGKVLGKGADPSSLERSLCVVAGIRGDEILQTLVCALFVEQLEKMERSKALTRGCLIRVIPCANPASMGMGRRFWPLDKTDINRMFPGNTNGETTQRIAAGLFAQVRGFTYGVHLSSFYLEGDFIPHVRVMHGPGECEDHGADFCLPYVTHYEPGSFDTTTLHYNWRLHGTEAYTLFTRKTTVADEGIAHDAVRSLLRFMSARGLTRRQFHGGSRTFGLAERFLTPVHAPVGGVCCPVVRVGDVVEKGQVLATIRDLLCGRVTARVVSPCDGVVFYHARAPLVNERALAFQIVPDDVDEVKVTSS